jgi:hypothetical protein
VIAGVTVISPAVIGRGKTWLSAAIAAARMVRMIACRADSDDRRGHFVARALQLRPGCRGVDGGCRRAISYFRRISRFSNIKGARKTTFILDVKKDDDAGAALLTCGQYWHDR